MEANKNQSLKKALMQTVIFFSIFLLLKIIFNYIPSLRDTWIGVLILLPIIIIIFTFLVKFIYRVFQNSFHGMMQSKGIVMLFSSYGIFIVTIIYSLSLAYKLIDFFKLGMLTYGSCSDVFSPALLETAERTKEYFYFTAITFFTVGYGDICPMGWSKFLSIGNAFLGNFINVVVMGMVVYYYLLRKDSGKGE